MSAAALLERCARLGVVLRCEGGALAFDGPEDALSEELLAELRAAKAGLLALLVPLSPAPPLSPAVRALARKLWPVALEACGDRTLAAEMSEAEARARLEPRGALHPAWCPAHDNVPAPGCAWCSRAPATPKPEDRR